MHSRRLQTAYMRARASSFLLLRNYSCRTCLIKPTPMPGTVNEIFTPLLNNAGDHAPLRATEAAEARQTPAQDYSAHAFHAPHGIPCEMPPDDGVAHQLALCACMCAPPPWMSMFSAATRCETSRAKFITRPTFAGSRIYSSIFATDWT